MAFTITEADRQPAPQIVDNTTVTPEGRVIDDQGTDITDSPKGKNILTKTKQLGKQGAFGRSEATKWREFRNDQAFKDLEDAWNDLTPDICRAPAGALQISW